jgi:RNA polymerase sigma-70 factor, ECF subfamily
MMIVNSEREPLVARLEAGPTTRPRDLFAELMDRAALDRAYRLAGLILGDRAEAEDAAHDAALAAWRHLGDLRDPTRFQAWFDRIVVNVCRDRLRSRRRRRVREIPPETSQEVLVNFGPRAADPADAAVRRQAMAQALGDLNHEERELIVFRYYLDLTVDQIAERLGIRPGTVKSRLHHALRRLRAAYDRTPDGGFDR